MRIGSIEDVMKSNVSTYSKYVAQERAIPSLVDGWKPSQRRSLLTGYDLKLFHNKRFLKAAKIEGDVCGNYHPHGGVSLAGLIQPFTIRYPIFEGQGNWGSPDMPGSFAASRYTEAKLTEFAERFYLESIDYSDREDNYDGRLKEITLFYPSLPGCMITGAMGIAIGFSTKIPTHNIRDLGYSLLDYIDGKESYINLIPDTCEESIVLTPKEEIKKLYLTGSGSVNYKAKTHYEKINNKIALVVDAFPPGYSKNRLQTASIIEAVESGDLELINESKDGIRYVFLSSNMSILEEIESRLTNSVGYNMYIEHRGVVKKYSLSEIYDTFIREKSGYIVRKYTDLVDKLVKEQTYLDILLRFKEDKTYIKNMFDKTSEDVINDIIYKYKTTKDIANRLISVSLRSLMADNTKQLLAKMDDNKVLLSKYQSYLDNPLSKVVEDIHSIIDFMKEDKRRAQHVDDTTDIQVFKYRGNDIEINLNKLYYVGTSDNTVSKMTGLDLISSGHICDDKYIIPDEYEYYVLYDNKGVVGVVKDKLDTGSKLKSGSLYGIIGTNDLSKVTILDGRGKSQRLGDWVLRSRSSYITMSNENQPDIEVSYKL